MFAMCLLHIDIRLAALWRRNIIAGSLYLERFAGNYVVF